MQGNDLKLMAALLGHMHPRIQSLMGRYIGAEGLNGGWMMDEWMDGWMDGWKDGWMDGWMDG